MTAECREEEITILGNEQWTVTRTKVGMIVVIFDLLIAFTLWISMVVLKPILKITEQEIDEDTITASDYTVIIRCPKTDTPIELLPAVYWHFVD